MQILEQAQDSPAAGNVKAQWVSLWTAPAVAAVLLVACLAFPGFRPPMPPTLPTDEVAAFYRDGYRGSISLETHWRGPDGDRLKASTICARALAAMVAEGGH